MQLEETQIALAKVVVFVRSHFCPYHEHMDVAIVTHDGVVTYHLPVCEVPELGLQCDFVDERNELLNECYMALGTRDMSSYI